MQHELSIKLNIDVLVEQTCEVINTQWNHLASF